jgi:hypothetical protein
MWIVLSSGFDLARIELAKCVRRQLTKPTSLRTHFSPTVEPTLNSLDPPEMKIPGDPSRRESSFKW